MMKLDRALMCFGIEANSARPNGVDRADHADFSSVGPIQRDAERIDIANVELALIEFVSGSVAAIAADHRTVPQRS